MSGGHRELVQDAAPVPFHHPLSCAARPGPTATPRQPAPTARPAHDPVSYKPPRRPLSMEPTPTPNSTRPKKQRSPRNRAPREGRALAMAGCCVFLRRPSTSSAYRLGYHSLDGDHEDGPPPAATVTVVVGKERRVFAVDQLVLDTYPFRVLLETVARNEERRGKALFVDVDAILFEHILWLAGCHDRSAVSLLQPDLKDIIDFYSQDA